MSTSAPPGHLDDFAREIARSVTSGELSHDEGARAVVSEAVRQGVVERQILAAHRSSISRRRHEVDEFVGGATFLFVHYALPREDGESSSPLDVTRFLTDRSSATGWVRRTVGSFRASRIEREIESSRDLCYLEDEVLCDPQYVPAPELDDRPCPDPGGLHEASRDRLRQGETLLLIQASLLHELTGGPALRSWDLSDSDRRDVRNALDEDPSMPARAVAPGRPTDSDAEDLVRALWGSWSQEQIEDVRAKSSPDRDIIGLLTRACVAELPKPPSGNRGRDTRKLRDRVARGLPRGKEMAAPLFDAFMADRVSLYADKDRHRAPLSDADAVRRQALATSFPMALSVASSASGIPRKDLLSGLVALCVEHIPALSVRHFVQTSWRFPDAVA